MLEGGRGNPPDPGALIGQEVEQPVPDDWAADRAAELVAVQAVAAPLAVGAKWREWVGGVQRVVADELEHAARQGIRADLVTALTTAAE